MVSCHPYMARKRNLNDNSNETDEHGVSKKRRDTDERISELEKEISEIENGTNKDIQKLNDLLTKDKEEKCRIAKTECSMKKEVAEKMYSYAIDAAEKIYQNDLEEGKKKLIEEIKGKIHQYEDGFPETRMSRRHPRTKQDIKMDIHAKQKKEEPTLTLGVDEETASNDLCLLNKEYQERQSEYDIDPVFVVAPLSSEILLYDNIEIKVGTTLIIKKEEEDDENRNDDFEKEGELVSIDDKYLTFRTKTVKKYKLEIEKLKHHKYSLQRI
ncbi:hypothetical protein WA158_000396 [Blastocystis sp. Blastoise]